MEHPVEGRAWRATHAPLRLTLLSTESLFYSPPCKTVHGRSGVAQLVEQLTVNQRVTGSSPVAGVRRLKAFSALGRFLVVGRVFHKSSTAHGLAVRSPLPMVAPSISLVGKSRPVSRSIVR